MFLVKIMVCLAKGINDGSSVWKAGVQQSGDLDTPLNLEITRCTEPVVSEQGNHQTLA